MDQDAIKDIYLRIMVRAGGCAGFSYDMQFDDTTKTTDTVFEYFGVELVVDEKSLVLLNGTEIDYVETLQSSGFKFNNPNTSASCGCGQSFA